MTDDADEQIRSFLKSLLSADRRFNSLLAHIFDRHLEVEGKPGRETEAKVLSEILEFARNTRSQS